MATKAGVTFPLNWFQFFAADLKLDPGASRSRNDTALGSGQARCWSACPIMPNMQHSMHTLYRTAKYVYNAARRPLRGRVVKKCVVLLSYRGALPTEISLCPEPMGDSSPTHGRHKVRTVGALKRWNESTFTSIVYLSDSALHSGTLPHLSWSLALCQCSPTRRMGACVWLEGRCILLFTVMPLRVHAPYEYRGRQVSLTLLCGAAAA